MMVARQSPQAGLLGGIGAGIAMDLASGKGPYYSMIYAIAGLVSGLCFEKRKLATSLAFLAAAGMSVLWTWENGIRLGLLYEVFAAAIVFMILPQKVCDVAGEVLMVRKPKNKEWEWTKEVVSRHMRATAKAFRELYESMRDLFKKEDRATEDVAVVFHRTAERKCRSCSSREVCWQKRYHEVQDALNNATGKMLSRGRAYPDDFPSYFRSWCIHFSDFLAIANEELTAFLYRRQHQKKEQESRAALCRQYAELDKIIGKAAAELGTEITPDMPREAKLQQFLQSIGHSGKGVVYYDENGHLCVEMTANQKLRTKEGREKLSKVLGVALRDYEEPSSGWLVFHQAEPFMAKAGVAVKSKKGETVSGDTGTWFRRDDGLLCMLLCDGMGSGEKAREESSLAVRLLQNFLKAGVESESAMQIVNSALALKGEETRGCTTIDLLTIELFTGLCSVYKFGAAPTYLRRKGEVSCVTGSALPAGIVAGDDVKPDVVRFRVEGGDWIIMLSDGVADGEEDSWIRQLLYQFQGKSPGELAEQISELGHKHNQSIDDSSVIAVHIEQRK